MYLHHKADHEFPRGTPVETVYLVCSVPRSGSSLLCELLMNTGLAGAPTEYLEPNVIRSFMQQWDLESVSSYVAALLDRKTSPNGVFGLKAHYGQLLDNRGREVIESILDRACFVSIYRRDRLRQAISYWRAVQTEQWASVHAGPAREPEFDYEQIRGLLERIRIEEEGWEALFDERGAQPFRVVYEDFIDATTETVQSVLHFLGVQHMPDVPLEPPTIQKQADDLTEDWVERYRAAEAEGGGR